jgi:hypothetical protein
MAVMKTTVDLPESLVKQVKLRAVRDGRKLQDTMADLLRRGLATESDGGKKSKRPIMRRDPKTNICVIQCPQKAPPGKELTPERIKDILLNQDVEFYYAAGG